MESLFLDYIKFLFYVLFKPILFYVLEGINICTCIYVCTYKINMHKILEKLSRLGIINIKLFLISRSLDVSLHSPFMQFIIL